MENAGESPDDRVQDAVGRSRPVRTYVDSVWPAVDPRRLLWRLLSDPDALRAAATGVLDEAECALLAWEPAPRAPGSAKWSAADAVLLDEVADLVSRVPSLGHVVLDEAQDLSPMQLRAVGRRCSTGSATVLGDIAQGTTAWATPGWEVSLHHLGKAQARVTVLDRGFRVPRTVLEFASRLLPVIAPGVPAATSVRESPGDLTVLAVPADGISGAVPEACRTALAREGSVGVIVADASADRVVRALRGAGLDVAELGGSGTDESADEPGVRLTVVPATLAKGLEYDSVVVVEPADIVDADAAEWQGLRRLYVCLTRAVSALCVVHARPLPGPLGGTA